MGFPVMILNGREAYVWPGACFVILRVFVANSLIKVVIAMFDQTFN